MLYGGNELTRHAIFGDAMNTSLPPIPVDDHVTCLLPDVVIIEMADE